MTDHCIITRYHLSDREKELKKAFFTKRDEKGIRNNDSTHQNNQKIFSNNLYNDEVIDKLVEDNFPLRSKIKSVDNLNNLNNPNHNNNNLSNQMPLNLIYSQNKILERNVDILQETQRSIHDLLVFNLKSYKNKETSKTESNNNELYLKQMQLMMTPLYNSIEGLKTSFNHISHKKLQDEGSNLNERVNDMVTKHNDFKENSNKFQRNVESLKINTKENSQIMKALEELKGSVTLINTEMGKIENEFNQNLKRIIEENEKKNLRNLMDGVNSTVSKMNSMSNKKKNVSNTDMIDYVEWKNELLDINHRKDEILNEFLFSKISIPKPKNPNEKINFSYKLDFEEEKNNLNYTGINSGYSTDKEIYNKDKNIFLNNLNNSNSENYVKTNTNGNNNNFHNIYQQSRSLSNKLIINKSTNSKNKSNINLSIKDNSYDNNNIHSGCNSNNNQNLSTNVYPNYQSPMNINNQSQENQNFNFSNQNENYNSNEEETNVIERMKKHKENLINDKKKKNIVSDSDLNSPNEGSSLINNFSTKNSDNRLVETSNKNKTKSIIKNNVQIIRKDSLINNNNIISDPSNKNENDIVLNQIKLAQNEIEKSNDHKIRKGITQIEVSPKEQKSGNLLQDIVLKLCLEKIIDKKENSKKISKEFEYVKEPSKLNTENNFMFDLDKTQVKFTTEGLLRDYVKNILKNRNNLKSNIEKEEEDINLNRKYDSTYMENESKLIIQLKQENERRDKDITNYLTEMMDRFNKIEKTVLNNQENNRNDKEGSIKNLNVDEIINKITEKVKENMQININLTTGNNTENNTQSIKPIIIIPTATTDIQIEGVKTKSQKEEINIEEVNKSTYSNPFADKRRVNHEEVNRDIQLPHMINLDEYEMSSSSYMTELDSRRSQLINKPNNNQIIKDESISEGQILITDENSSSILTQNYNDKNKKISNKIYANTGLNLDMLKEFNLQLKDQLLDIENHTISNRSDINEINYTPGDSNRSESGYYTANNQNEEDQEESTISINVNKHLNNNQYLKSRDLYDSEEHRLFQRQFGEDSERIVDTQMSRRIFSENNNSNFNSGRFISVNNFSNNSANNFSNNYNNNTNPVLFSFQKVLSNRSNQESETNLPQSRTFNSLPKLMTTVNNVKMENLILSQNNLNNRLQILSNNYEDSDNQIVVNNINTIPENNTEAEATLNIEENNITHTIKTKTVKKVYKTDESSFNNSYSN